VLFTEQSVGAVRSAVEQFENCRPAITAAACRENAMRFTAARFQTEMARAFDMAQTLHAKAFN